MRHFRRVWCFYDWTSDTLGTISTVLVQQFSNIKNGKDSWPFCVIRDKCMPDYVINDSDELVKETHTEPGVCFWLNDKPVYAYTSNGQVTHYRLFGSSENIGPLRAYLLGIPSKWADYCMAMVLGLLPIAFLLPAFLSFPRKRESRKGTGFRVKHGMTASALWRHCLCVLLAYLMLINPAYLQEMAQATISYSNLSRANWGTINTDIHYSYDANGSCVKKIKAVKDTPDPDTAFIEKTIYVYNIQNQLEQVKTTTDGVNWDITTYAYDDDGNRVQKNVNGTVTKYLVDSHNHTGYTQVLEERPASGVPTVTYIIGDDVIAQCVPLPKFYLCDGQGSVRHHSSAGGGLYGYGSPTCNTFAYDAYGQRVDPAQSSSAASTGLFYTGQQWDSKAKMYYLRARYYDPLNGRFNQTDPFAGNNQDPQSLHKYLYCHANPVNGVDPTGQFFNLVGALTIIAIIARMAAMVGIGLLSTLEPLIAIRIGLAYLTIVKVNNTNTETKYTVTLRKPDDLVFEMQKVQQSGEKIRFFEYLGHGFGDETDEGRAERGWGLMIGKEEGGFVTGPHPDPHQAKITTGLVFFDNHVKLIQSVFEEEALIELEACYSAFFNGKSIAHKFKNALPKAHVWGYTGKSFPLPITGVRESISAANSMWTEVQ